MIYLVGSIVLASYLTLSFKAVERLRIDNFQAIVFNYITCVITGSIVNGYSPFTKETIQQSWFGWACFMGFVFISLFNIVAFTAQKISVSAASVAYKLSLVIPFGFSIYLYNEKLTTLKFLGIIIALIAVVLTCLPPKKEIITDGPKVPGGKTKSYKYLLILMPVLLFVGSGLLDTMIKYVEQRYLDESNKNTYLIMAFASAATIGTVTLIILVISGRQKLSWKAMLAGAAIGVPNYFSIWCLLRVLKDYQGNSSAIIPINNMGIVLFSALVAWLVFREKLSLINLTGIALAVSAIALIAYG